MTPAHATALAASLFLAAFASPAIGAATADAPPGSTEVEFRFDDAQARRIATRLLQRQIANHPERQPEFRTGWARISDSGRPVLLVMYGCAPVGNCGLYGFERSHQGWRLILHSIAQRCWVMPTSHERRRDLLASMHGSATESTLKTYWWRQNRYVRVSVRNVTFTR